MRKWIIVLVIITGVLFNTPVGTYAHEKSDTNWLISDCADSGLLSVCYNNCSGERMKLKIEKDDKCYYYNLDADGKEESFSLQMGSGEYRIKVLENINGNKYKTVENKKIYVDVINQEEVYLQSVQNIKWDESTNAVKKADKLAEGRTNDQEIVNAVYNYITSEYDYDYDKLSWIQAGYIPDANEFYLKKKGICYDFSCMLAVMLRSQGIPTKLITGYADYAEGVYHAWNEVYIDGEWKTIDITYDSIMNKSGVSYDMFKNTSDYKKKLEY